jgi:hypothetical protein
MRCNAVQSGKSQQIFGFACLLFLVGFLFGLFFEPEAGDMFYGNVV